MEPEEEDGDDQKSEEDSIDYPTSGGDNDADDDGDDLSEDDADDEEEEEEHLALTVPAPALYKVERLLSIPTPPLSPVSPTSYLFPPLLMPLPIFTPLPTSSFPLPSSLPSTSGSESIPKADIPLRKRARFTTPTSGYENEEREAIFSYLVYHLCTEVTQMKALQRDVGTLQRQHIEHAQRDVAPEDGDRVATAMAKAEVSRVRNGYGSNGSGPRLAQAVRVALTWWNSHVKTVTLEVVQALPWKTLKKMMTDNRRFQELALMCDRTFPEESDRVEKYIGGVLDTIHDSVKAAKPKTMQDAIEFSTEVMDKRIRDAVENK
nr:hypothetical protein [Tanacetum cinerariifolium]